MTLQGLSAIVTGGGRGIGEAIASAYARAGASLTLVARSSAEIDAVSRRIRDAGGRAQAVVADVAREADAGRIVDRCVAEFGRVDVLVNCAGIYGPIGLLHESNAADWVRAIETNLLGTFQVTRAVLPLMVEQRHGKIVNMSGGGATAPLPRFSAYGVSKAAVVRLTETLAEELRPFNVQVNAIAPGAIDTRLQDEVLAAEERAGDLYGRIHALRESGAGGTPIQVPVDLAVFLASPASGTLTGKLIAAPHDDWRDWDETRIAELNRGPWLTLRRIDQHTLRPLKDQLD